MCEDFALSIGALKADIYKEICQRMSPNPASRFLPLATRNLPVPVVAVKRNGLYPNMVVNSLQIVDEDNAEHCIVSGRMHADGTEFSCDLADITVEGMVDILKVVPEADVDMDVIRECFEEFDGEQTSGCDVIRFHKDKLSVSSGYTGTGVDYLPTLQYTYLQYKNGKISREQFLENVTLDVMLPF